MNRNKYFFIFGLFVLAFTSCLKHDVYIMNTKQTPNVVMLANSGTPISSANNSIYSGYFADLGVLKLGDTTGFNVNVEYAGSGTPSSDISVNLAIDTAKLRVYNTQNNSSYVLPTSDIYTIPSSATLKAGTKMVQARVVIKSTSTYNYNVNYALPITVSSSNQAVSSNAGTAIYSFAARNSYDGYYSIKGYILRAGDNVLSGNYTGYNVNMSTSGAYSIKYEKHVWATGSSVAGIDGLTLTVDPTTNKVKVSSVSNPAVTNLTTYDNRYDPTTKTFYVSYYWGTGPTNRAATDTLTYLHAR